MEQKKGEVKISKESIKKIILTLLVLVTFIFMVCNRELLYENGKYKVRWGVNETEYSMLGNKTVEQKFQMSKGELMLIRIRFHNQGREVSKGKVTVAILDESGKELGSVTKGLKKIGAHAGDRFQFDEPLPMKKGETYTVRITTKNARNSQGFFLFLNENKGWMWKELTLDGEPSDLNIEGRYRTRFFATKNIIMMLTTLVFALAMIWLPWKKINAFVEKKCKQKERKVIDVQKLMARILFFASPLVAFIIVEQVNGFGIVGFFDKFFTWRGILNSLILGIIWWLFYSITNRMKYTASLMVVVPLILALANYFVWEFRGTPIIASDIASIGTAANVAKSYEYILNMDCVMAIVYTAAYTISVLAFPNYKGLKWRPRLAFAGCLVVLMASCYGIFFHSDFAKSKSIRVRLWKPQLDYAHNGSALSFMLTCTYASVEKPEGYSEEKVQELMEKYPSDTISGQEDMPNVICIMNEAFSDLAVNAKIPVSEDYMPFVRSLEEDTVKGYAHVSVRGGNTANSEFEFLTGNSLAFFSYRSVPYTTYVKDVTPSLTHTLKSLGFTYNKAMHPYLASGWKRPFVYPLLGFEGFLDQECYENPEYIRNFISDKTDYEKIISEYENTRKNSDAPFYTFNVTMQNHGGYSGGRGMIENEIFITKPKLKDEQAEQYFTLIKKSDEAFKDLLAYFEKVDEKTVILMFGDHQPSVHDDFYRKLHGKKLSALSPEDNDKLYQTPFVLWANYDIEEEKDKHISLNYLSSYLLDVIGADMTGYNKFLLDMHEKVPVITGECYMGDDGKYRSIQEKSEYSEYINEYQILQYNSMFDKKNRVNEFFFLDTSVAE